MLESILYSSDNYFDRIEGEMTTRWTKTKLLFIDSWRRKNGGGGQGEQEQKRKITNQQLFIKEKLTTVDYFHFFLNHACAACNKIRKRLYHEPPSTV